MSTKPTYDEVVAAYDALVAEKERYRTALEQISYVEEINPSAYKIALDALRRTR
ncbi:MAG: hypothetical protein JWL86_5445 [Rhizobium sp.]|nr:hypothetical protein [Rhizobium sp.]